MSIHNSWHRIADWYRLNTPQDMLRLAPGASEEQIMALEQVLGARLPDDMRESYLLHNGTEGTYLVHWNELLSLEAIEQHWRTYSEWQQNDGWGLGDEWEPDSIGWGYGADYTPRESGAEQPWVTGEPIKSIWWNPLRIPVTNQDADHLFIDLDPADGGEWGQLINYSHEVGPLRVLAPSWSAWLAGIADGLESGKLVYDEADEAVSPLGLHARSDRTRQKSE